MKNCSVIIRILLILEMQYAIKSYSNGKIDTSDYYENFPENIR